MSLLGYSVLSSQTLISRLILLVETKLQDKNQYFFDIDHFHLHLEETLPDKEIVFILNRHFDSKNLNYRAELVYYLFFSTFYIPKWKTQIKISKL